MDGYVEDEEKQKDYFERIIKECAGMERLVSRSSYPFQDENPDFQLDYELLNVISQ